MLKNMCRHFFVAFGAVTYLTFALVFLYQYLGLMNGWPGVFLSVVYDASGDWWLDIDWHSRVIWTTLLLTCASSVAYAAYRRNDRGWYRNTEIQSQAGF
jgi:hypothetical protein